MRALSAPRREGGGDDGVALRPDSAEPALGGGAPLVEQPVPAHDLPEVVSDAWASIVDVETAKTKCRPPVHFSELDPWRDYRLMVHYSTQPSFGFDHYATAATAASAAATAASAIAWLRPEDAGSQLPRVSRFKGVVWDRSSASWRAKMKIKGKTWYLGLYKDETSAAQAYDAACYFVYGAHAIANCADVDYSGANPPRSPPVWVLEYIIHAEAAGGLVRSDMAQRYIAQNYRPVSVPSEPLDGLLEAAHAGSGARRKTAANRRESHRKRAALDGAGDKSTTTASEPEM